MTEKRFKEVFPDIIESSCRFTDNGKGITHKEVVDLLNKLNDEVMDLRAENTRFKLIVSDIVDDLEKQAKSEKPIIISRKYVDWIKKELDLRLYSDKGDVE